MKRKLEADEIPLPPIAQPNGRWVSLKCRTIEEAYLVCEELEKEDILTILPEEDELQAMFERDGYVELKVSAKSYESSAQLRSSVEFQYQQLRSEQPLSAFGKFIAFLMGFAILLGIFVFLYFLNSYRNNGYTRKAQELKVWFLLGLSMWVLFVVLQILF